MQLIVVSTMLNTLARSSRQHLDITTLSTLKKFATFVKISHHRSLLVEGSRCWEMKRLAGCLRPTDNSFVLLVVLFLFEVKKSISQARAEFAKLHKFCGVVIA